jgi:DNA-directed RNA polymerase subunit beta'
MQLKQLERVLYFENYIVIEPGLTPLEKFQLLTEDELLEAQDEYGEDAFSAASVRKPCAACSKSWIWKAKATALLDELAVTKSELKPKKIIKRLKVVEASWNRATVPNG